MKKKGKTVWSHQTSQILRLYEVLCSNGFHTSQGWVIHLKGCFSVCSILSFSLFSCCHHCSYSKAGLIKEVKKDNERRRENGLCHRRSAAYFSKAWAHSFKSKIEWKDSVFSLLSFSFRNASKWVSGHRWVNHSKVSDVCVLVHLAQCFFCFVFLNSNILKYIHRLNWLSFIKNLNENK